MIAVLRRLTAVAQYPEVARFLRFAIVGTLTAAVYLGLLWLGVSTLALSTLVASIVAFVLAIGFNYVLHKSWTFSDGQNHMQTGPRYVAMTFGGLIINSTILHFGTDVWKLGLWGPQFVAIAAMVIYNFAIMSLFVFKPKDQADA